MKILSNINSYYNIKYDFINQLKFNDKMTKNYGIKIQHFS